MAIGTIGIVAAMHDEISSLLAAMGASARIETIGRRDYYCGRVDGHDCIVVLARIGKVAAAATVTTLIRDFAVSEILFTGLAGGIGEHVAVGDVVVADQLIQHDMDCRPLFPLHHVPLLDLSHFPAEATRVAALQQAAQRFIDEDLRARIPAATLAQFGIRAPRLHTGLIASGDRFIHAPGDVDAIRAALPDALAVEMEGAAVAQICHEYGIPCTVVRTISDRADSSAPTDFNAFLAAIASVYSAGMIRRYLALRTA